MNLVTGGCGFIGSHLVEELIRIGERVKVYDDLSTGKTKNLEDASGDAKVILHTPTAIVDEEEIFRSIDGVDTVYHLAAVPSVPKSVANPMGTHSSGTDLTMAMLYCAMKSGVKRFVYASSSSVYGIAPSIPLSEDAYIAPASPYAATKASGEMMCSAFSKCYDIDCVSLRFFNVYGPRQDKSSPYSGVVAKFCDAFSKGEDIQIFGSGEQIRDFIYVKDVCKALIAAGHSKTPFEGAAINVGSGRETSVLDIVDVLSETTGIKKDPIFRPARPGDVPYSLACVNKMNNLLNYKAETSLEDGLKQTYEWYK